MGVPRDQNGLRFYSEGDIERIAKRFLTAVAPQCLARPVPVPIFRIVRHLEMKGEFRYVSADLGPYYLGAYDIQRKVLYIHKDLLDGDPRLAFTAAHELGHYYLHGRVNPAIFRDTVTDVPAPTDTDITQDTQLILDGPREIVLGRFQNNNPRTIAEWQANRFAGAILIPARTLKAALMTVQRYIGINHNLGVIWLTNQPGSYSDFRSVIRLLAERYQTSQPGLFTPNGIP
jgi:hypothetical protein